VNLRNGGPVDAGQPAADHEGAELDGNTAVLDDSRQVGLTEEAAAVTDGPGAVKQPTKGRGRRWVRPVFASLAVGGAAAVLALTVRAVVAGSSDATGYVEPATTVQLNFQASAPVLQVDVHPGQVVRAGQVLATQNESAIQAKLFADQATMAADQQKLRELETSGRGATGSQSQLTPDQVALRNAERIAKDTTTADIASVAKAQSAVDAAQHLVTADQQQIASNAATCANIVAAILPAAGQPANTTAGSPSGLTASGEVSLLAVCQDQQHQLAQDQAALTSAQASLQQAQATATLDADNAGAAVSTDEAQLATDNQSQPSTVAAAEAAVATDQSAIKADQTALDGAVLRAPMDGIVAWVGGVAGDIASSDGVHQFNSPNPLPAQPQSGIELFPSTPIQQSSPSSTEFAPLITLDSARVKIIAQVGESSIQNVHIGEVVGVSLPAFPNASMRGTVAAIDPAAINNSGKVSYQVEINVNAPAAAVEAVAGSIQGTSPGRLLPGLSADIKF
jgi:HlyD family secretion protein